MMKMKMKMSKGNPMKKFLLGLGLAVLLAGCGTNVPLNDVKVEDRTGTQVTPLQPGNAGGAGNSGGQVGARDVQPVDLGKSADDGIGPNGPRLVYFDYDSFEIKPEFQALIETHARFLKADPRRKAVLEGHTDDRGGREYNLALGQKRAEAVRRALGLLGVADAQIEAVSFGKEKPAAPGGDEASMALNRRAEIVYR